MKQHWMDAQDGLIIEGDILDALAQLEDESVEAIVTDPPYELKFMGKSWDQSGVSFQPETWAACLRVLKPGGHMVVFGGTRTHHRMWCAIEDAGFEVRDMLLWLYGQGMPKSYNVGQGIEKLQTIGSARRPDRDLGVGRRYVGEHMEVNETGGPVELTTEEAQEWAGWGTGLKPSVEPILLARKPMTEKNVATNVLKYGTGALNIDATRISTEGEIIHTPKSDPAKRKGVVGSDLGFSKGTKDKMAAAQKASVARANELGRWPANVLLQCICDDPQPLPEKTRKRRGEPSQERRYDKKGATNLAAKPGTRREGGGFIHGLDCPAGMLDAQSGISKSAGGQASLGAFRGGRVYGAGKDIREKRDPGLGDVGGASRFFYCPKASKSDRGEGNTHPTVKPIALMRWLVRMVTPPEGVVLDPFCGSGSTLVAAVEEGYGFIGIDISPEYCEIARKRLRRGRKS